MEYLDRNLLWQSDSLSGAIQRSKVLIAGVGGLGWQIGASLVGLGVQRFSIFDPDPLEAVNLNRLWGCSLQMAGKSKVELFADLTKGVSQDIQINTYAQSIPSEAFELELADSDVIFGGFDAPEPRLATQVLAKKHKKLYIDAGVTIKCGQAGLSGTGQVFRYRGGYDESCASGHSQACILCAGLGLNNKGYLDEQAKPLPSSGVLNGILGQLAVSTWLKILQQENVPDMLYFNWNNFNLIPVWSLPVKPDCPLCFEDAET